VADRTVAVPQSAITVRIISAIVLAVPTIAAIAWGRPFIEAWFAVFAVLMAREWHELCGGRGWTMSRIALAASTLAVLILAAIDRYQAAVAVIVLGIPILYALSRQAKDPAPAFTAAGLPYIALAGFAVSWLRATPGSEAGLFNLLWLFGVVWGTDTAAYVVGRTVGGPKLARTISPGKTWSGAVGGLLGAAAVGAGLALAAGVQPFAVVAASLALSVVAQAGDLAESAVKRRFGVKDSGSIIPGHGGLFDRADALLAAAPAMALTLYFVGVDALWR
jgi:phosphatidate cytidylyltransferase